MSSVTPWQDCFPEDEKCKKAYWTHTPELKSVYDKCMQDQITKAQREGNTKNPKETIAEWEARIGWPCVMKAPPGQKDKKYGEEGWEEYWKDTDPNKPQYRLNPKTNKMEWWDPKCECFLGEENLDEAKELLGGSYAWLAIPAGGILFFCFTERGGELLHGPNAYLYVGGLALMTLFFWRFSSKKSEE